MVDIQFYLTILGAERTPQAAADVRPIPIGFCRQLDRYQSVVLIEGLPLPTVFLVGDESSSSLEPSDFAIQGAFQ